MTLDDPRMTARREPAPSFAGSEWEYIAAKSREPWDDALAVWLATPGRRQQSWYDAALVGYRLGVEHAVRAAALLPDVELRAVLAELELELARREADRPAEVHAAPQRPNLGALRARQ